MLAVDNCEASGTRTLEDLRVGDVCLIQFHVQRQSFWNRAEIVDISKKGNATVSFVDYGNEVAIPLTEVFELESEDMMKHPAACSATEER